MKIVFIGHTGFIGKSIYHHLSLSNQIDLKGISSKEVDLTKKLSDKSLLNNISPNCVVIMCAGLKKQLGDNLGSFESNLKIITNFSKAISESKPKKIIFFSSASVYGEDVDYTEEISEKTNVHPRTFYGIGKYAAELLLTKICSDNEIKLLIIRPPLVYGKNDKSRGYGPTGFVYKVLNGEEIVIWGDGNEFREFIYVEDLGRAVEELIKNDTTGVLNFVSGKSYRFKEIVEILNSIKW